MRALLLLGLLAVVTSGCTDSHLRNQLQPSSTPGYETFTLPGTLSVDVPEGWKVDGTLKSTYIFTGDNLRTGTQTADELMLIVSSNQSAMHPSLVGLSPDYLTSYANWYFKDRASAIQGFTGEVVKREQVNGHDTLFLTTSFVADKFDGTVAADLAFIHENDTIYALQYSYDNAVPEDKTILTHAVDSLVITSGS